jgi:hypothetical protein
LRIRTLRPEFVEFVPDALEPGVLYISVPYATASHACACGCAEKVVTPIRPTDWSVLWDGETVSLRPSIGNWSLPCRSHYWIRNNRVIWAAGWSQQEVEAARERDRLARTVSHDRPRARRTKRAAGSISD